MADGNSFNTARVKNPSRAGKSVNGTLSGSDPADYFRFRIPFRRGTIDFSLDNIPNGSNFSLEVFDSDRRKVRQSRRPGNRAEDINLNVNRGDYFVRVSLANNSSRATGRYRLTVRSNPDRAGNIREGARNLDEVLTNGSVTIRDYVSRGDRRDFYTFTLDETSVVTTTFRSFEPNANLLFQDGTGTDLSNPGFRTVEKTLEAGEQAIRVVPIPVSGKGVATRYSLQLDIAPVGGGGDDGGGDNGGGDNGGGTPPVDNVGDGFETARNLNVSSTETTFDDNIGGADTSDFFRFTTDTVGNLELSVAGNNQPIQFNLFSGQRQFLNTAPGSLSVAGLQSGTYFVQLVPANNGAPSSPYTLSALLAPDDTVGNTFGSAKNITVDATERTESEIVGGTDPADFYRFSASQPGDLRLGLSGNSAPITVTLFDQAQSQIATSAGNNLDVEGLTTGTYFIRVAPTNSGAPFTDYDLSTFLAPDQVGDSTIDATLITDPGTDPFPVIDDTPQIYSDFASTSDDDVFQLNLTEDYNFVSLNLQNLNADLNLEFFEEGSPDVRVSSTLSGKVVDALEGSVGPGTYFVRVFAPPGSAGSSYDLEMSVDSANVRPSITRDIDIEGDSNPRFLTDVTNLSEVFFAASSNAEGLGLYRSQGTLDTTLRVGDFSTIESVAAVGSSVYVFGSRPGTGEGLYLWTPGTTPTGEISLVEDNLGIPLDDNITIRELAPVGNNLYFLVAPVGTPQDVTFYRTDGTTATQIPLTDDNIPENFSVVGNTLFYTEDGILQRIENANAATPSAPETLTTIDGITFDSIEELRVIGDDLFFTGAESAGGSPVNREWRRLNSSGQLSTYDINNDPDVGGIVGGTTLSLAVADGFVYFVAGEDQELYRADLSATPDANTLVATEALPPIEASDFLTPNILGLTSYNDQLFFSANANDGDGQNLFVITDPSAASPPTATKVSLPNTTGEESLPESFTIANGTLYFTATTDATGREIWSYNSENGPATDSNSYELPLNFEIVDGPGSSEPRDLTVVGDTTGDGSGGRIYFTANDGTRGQEVWVV